MARWRHEFGDAVYDDASLRKLWGNGDWCALLPVIRKAVRIGASEIIYRERDYHDLLEDIAHDVLIRCMEFGTVPDGPYNFLKVAARNRALDIRKSADKRFRIGVDVYSDAEVLGISVEQPDVGDSALRDSFMAALRTLPAWGQEILRLRIRDGLSYDEIVRRTGFNKGQAKMRMSRAKGMMRKAWHVPVEYTKGRPHYQEKRFSPYAAAA